MHETSRNLSESPSAPPFDGPLLRLPVCRGWSIDGPKHGGIMRSLQLVELFRQGGVELVSVEASPRSMTLTELSFGVGTWLTGRGLRRTGIGAAATVARAGALRTALEPWAGAPAVIVENTVSPHVAVTCARMGFRVWAFPHNVESLNNRSNRRFHRSGGLDGAREEARFLDRWCERSFAISSEDAWLLSQVCGPVAWLPYVPPRTVLERCERVRRRRSGGGGHILVLNTHQPTNAPAVRSLLRFLNEKGIRAVVCGHGTEAYAAWGPWDTVSIAGAVSDDELERLLTTASAAVIWNERGAGALTRIPELLLSGLPVVCNLNAARSAWSWSGLHVVNELEDLPAAIDAAATQAVRAADAPPTVPLLIKSLLDRFVAEVRATLYRKQ